MYHKSDQMQTPSGQTIFATVGQRKHNCPYWSLREWLESKYFLNWYTRQAKDHEPKEQGTD